MSFGQAFLVGRSAVESYLSLSGDVSGSGSRGQSQFLGGAASVILLYVALVFLRCSVVEVPSTWKQGAFGAYGPGCSEATPQSSVRLVLK